MKKKGQSFTLGGLPGVVSLMVVAVLVLTFVTDITDDIRGNFADEETNLNCADNGFNCTSAAHNVSTNTVGGLDGIGGQFGNTGTVIGAAVIIGILIAAFAFRGGSVSLR